MKRTDNQQGFTLVELILVIVILGVLAVSVAPKFVDVQTSAQAAQADAVVAAIRDGITLQYANNLLNNIAPLYPDMLDWSAGGPASPANPLFGNVLQSPITAGWERTGDNYRHIVSGQSYRYYKADGLFDPAPFPGGP